MREAQQDVVKNQTRVNIKMAYADKNFTKIEQAFRGLTQRTPICEEIKKIWIRMRRALRSLNEEMAVGNQSQSGLQELLENIMERVKDLASRDEAHIDDIAASTMPNTRGWSLVGRNPSSSFVQIGMGTTGHDVPLGLIFWSAPTSQPIPPSEERATHIEINQPVSTDTCNDPGNEYCIQPIYDTAPSSTIISIRRGQYYFQEIFEENDCEDACSSPNVPSGEISHCDTWHPHLD